MGQPRQQAAKSSAGVSDQFGFRSEFGCFCPPQCSLRNGGGAEMTDLTDTADALHRAQPRGANPFAFGDRRSLAPYCRSWPICGASRPRQFAAVEMSGSVPRNLCSGCGSEWSGRKVTSPASGAAEPCRYLVRGTSTSVGSVTVLADGHLAEIKKATASDSERSPPRGAKRRVSNPLTFSRLTPRQKPFANQKM
jgi:hypothetical protein